ncbi:MAG: hypothetical protein JXR63_04810 [Spirochaetales bacterium]|nr:hypothetical protein [Spirochaetales bacterium]
MKSIKKTNSLDAQQKVLLNRKANQLFNEGNIDQARQIFLATGYSDGLRRMGDYYREKNDFDKALQMYCLAGHSNQAEDLIKSVATVIKNLIREGD